MLLVLPIFTFGKEISLKNHKQQKNNRKFPMKLNKPNQVLTLWQATCRTLTHFQLIISSKIGISFCLCGTWLQSHIDFGGISVVQLCLAKKNSGNYMSNLNCRGCILQSAGSLGHGYKWCERFQVWDPKVICYSRHYAPEFTSSLFTIS